MRAFIQPPAAAPRPIASRDSARHRTDEELFSEYRAGNPASFTRLTERYREELYLFLVRKAGDRAAAEDLVQDTFLRVHRSSDQFDGRRSLRPWLFRIAINLTRDRFRSQALRQAVSLDGPMWSVRGGKTDGCPLADRIPAATHSPLERLLAKEERDLVWRTLGQMPARFRDIVRLAYYDGLSYEQIGERLGIPLGTVKSRLHSAVAAFANGWRPTTSPRRRPSSA